MKPQSLRQPREDQFLDTLPSMCASPVDHIVNVAASLSQAKIVSRNRSRQSELIVSHRPFNLFLVLTFMNRGQKEVLFFSFCSITITTL